MKKVVIIAAIVLVVIIAIVVKLFSTPNVEKVLSKFNSSEKDGFEKYSGYIVSNKTSQGYRYGYVSYNGNILLKVEYNRIYRILDLGDKDNIFLIAEKNGRYGVSKNGKEYINYEYQFIEYNSTNEIFILNRSNKYGIADKDGNILIPIENDSIQVKGKYLYVVNNDNEYVCDKNGNKLDIDFNEIFEETDNPNYRIMVINKNDTYVYSLVNQNGQKIIQKDYDYLEYVANNYFIATDEDGKQGIIDDKGNIKLDFKYSMILKMKNTSIIRTLDTETNETELYNTNLEKICEMTNATITLNENSIKIFNQTQEKEFDFNGNKK